jgi:histidinol dehydrogenase
MRIVPSSNAKAVAALLAGTHVRDQDTEQRAARIVSAVRREGDRALRRYARDLDGWAGPLEIARDQWEAGASTVSRDVRTALARAARHIRRVARAQVPRGFKIAVRRGVVVEQRVEPLSRVGCYVPGGLYPLPSSLLMTAMPARVAGVKEIVAACPRLHPAVLAAAIEAGVDRLFQMGGAHGIAAMAYGTRSVPRVDKIVGPGNKWVSAAKALVSRDCAIDFFAGPTEILVVTNSGPARWIAADLIAQAEHDPDARAIMITTKRALARAVAAEVERMAPEDGPARASLARHGGIILCANKREALSLANAAAAEHVVVEDERMAKGIKTGGALFIGRWTAQVAGDYAIGSNHVLPTAGAARFRGGLNAADFVRLMSVQRVSRHGLAGLAPTITTLARAEGLNAHALSIEVRRAARSRS